MSWSPRRMSFRARLGTFTALAVGLTVALASLASYFTVKHQLYAQVDGSLRNDVTNFAVISPRGLLRPDAVSQALRQTGGLFQEFTADGTVLDSSLQFASPGAAVLQPTSRQVAVAASAPGASRVDTETFEGTRYRVLTLSAVQQVGGGFGSFTQSTDVAIQIGLPLTQTYRTLSLLRLILWLVTLGGIGLAIAFGYVIGRATLRPVARLTSAAEHVAATQDLSSTIESEGEDELARLANAFNAMLMALAASRAQQAQLISDAGHELRTPLTSLRTNIEVLMKVKDLPAGDRAELMQDVEAQLAELTTLVGDLVDLARHEEGRGEVLEVRFDEVVERAVERARRRAPSVSFETHLTPGAVRGQPALLERAVLNVLDNAAKWSPPGGRVEVWLQRGALWNLDVHDHGPGIAAEDLPRVFDRFYRAPAARSMPGSGLGLAIVRQIITEHDGRVGAYVPPEGGTVVHIELPTVAEAEPDAVPESGSDPESASGSEPVSASGSEPVSEPVSESGSEPGSESGAGSEPGPQGGVAAAPELLYGLAPSPAETS